MQWFKHDSNANTDDKLQQVLLDYGLEGYGLYWYCLELIVNRVDKDNITFELKHDARVIARNTGSTPQKVEEMMRRFIELGLFEADNGMITCFKLIKRMDSSMTSNAYMREIIANAKQSHDGIMTQSANIMQDKNRLEENILNTLSSGKPDNCPHENIISIYHEMLPSLPRVKVWNDKRKRMLKGRWSEEPKRQSLDYWKRFFDKVSRSDFLMGRTGNKPFVCTLEWLVTPSNFIKVIEGNYDNR